MRLDVSGERLAAVFGAVDPVLIFLISCLTRSASIETLGGCDYLLSENSIKYGENEIKEVWIQAR
jgi:hypothetical protein